MVTLIQYMYILHSFQRLNILNYLNCNTLTEMEKNLKLIYIKDQFRYVIKIN